MGNVLEEVAHRPQQFDPFSPAPRKPLGTRWDWVIELARQLYRPALGLICVLAMLDYTLLAQWFRAGEGRISETALGLVLAFAAALAGMRTAEVTRR